MRNYKRHEKGNRAMDKALRENPGEEHTQEVIAELIGITRQGVNEAEKTAWKKVRRSKLREKLLSFIEDK